MSVYSNKAVLSLLNMTQEMFRKSIEIRRITKVCTLLMMSGLDSRDISRNIIERCVESQNADGGFIGNTDTLWNVKFLSFFPEYEVQRLNALNWLINNNGNAPGFGRSKRDMHRIPTTGLALYLLPELASEQNLIWLEDTWCSECNSLTYKASYTLMAFAKNSYKPKRKSLISETAIWLMSQQENNGGFAPWLNHPVGPNVYCTSVALIALLALDDTSFQDVIQKGYNYLCRTQLKSGIWPYHEIEDGASWGLLALTQAETFLEKL